MVVSQVKYFIDRFKASGPYKPYKTNNYNKIGDLTTELTHYGTDKMAAILSMTFCNSCVKIVQLDSNCTEILDAMGPIRSSDNDSTGFGPPGSLHTLGADGHI